MSSDVYVRQHLSHESLRRPLAVWCAAATVALVMLSLVVGAPLLAMSGHPSLASVIYGGFEHVCHQINERSFHIGDHKFAVCARCFGIYAGFAGGVVLYPLVRSLRRRDTPARVWLIAATVPICIDFALGFFGIWENTHWSRAMTGAVVGATAAVYVVPGVVDLVYMDWRRFFTRSGARETNVAR